MCQNERHARSGAFCAVAVQRGNSVLSCFRVCLFLLTTRLLFVLYIDNDIIRGSQEVVYSSQNAEKVVR